MDARGRVIQSSLSTFKLKEPEVCSVYPTCVLICWDTPRASNDLADADRIQWSYLVECSTNHSNKKRVSSVSTNFCHAVIKVLYPNEIIHLRIVARGSTSSDVIAFASSKRSIDTSRTIPMPWLHSSSMQCRCIFDALLFAENGLQCVEAMPTEIISGIHVLAVDVLPVRMLESTFASIILQVTYDAPPLPITSCIVYYFIICSKSLVKQRERLRYRGIQEMIEKDNACAIFCGIGEMGSSAALTAHLFISSGLGSSNELRARVFCMAYGSPRRMFVEDLLVLASSSAFSGNFLYYTGLLVPPDRASGYTNALFPSETKETPKEEASIYFNVPLGVRCGPLMNVEEGSYAMLARCSGIETLVEEEYYERLHISEHLRILSRLLISGGDSVLMPVIETVSHTMEDGIMVYLTLTGKNLQYKPQVCVSSKSGYPTTATVVSVRPCELRVSFSLVEMLVHELTVRKRYVRRFGIEIALLTDMGHVLSGFYRVPVPEDMARLLFIANQEKSSIAWLFSHPMNLLDNAIIVEAFLTTTKTKESSKTGFASHGSTQTLGALATAAEVANHYGAKRHSVSLFSFVQNVAAKVSNSGSQSMTPMAIQVPAMREAAILDTALEEYTNNRRKRTVSTVLSKLTPWKQRLLQGLTWLSDAKYSEKVRTLLGVFEKISLPRDAPLAALELALWTAVVRYLRGTCGLNNVGHLLSLDACLQFETFYQHVHPLFLVTLPAGEHLSLDILLESIALWTICLVFHLRCFYFFTHIIVVTGCAGSGCSTTCNTLRRLSAEEDYSFRASIRIRNVVIRRAEECELDDLKEVLILGMGSTVVVMGELADIKGMGYTATLGSIQRSRSDGPRQRIKAFLSKLDEQIGKCEETPPVGDEAVTFLRDKIVRSLGENAPGGLRAVSFAPSVALLKKSLFVEQSGISAECFADKLLHASLQELRKILKDVRK